jgi:hypothetical protein
LVTGSTGSGKTTAAVRPIIRALLKAHREKPELRPGLLVIDAKGDDTIDCLHQFSREAKRTEDLRILGPHGNIRYGLFHGFTRLSQLDEWVSKLLSGSREMGSQNEYWTETRKGLLGSALTILRASSPGEVTFAEALEFFESWWFGSQGADPRRIAVVEQVLRDRSLDPQTVRRLRLALQDVASWKDMDSKLRETHKTCLLNMLRPLSTPAAAAYFSGQRESFMARDVLDGRIVLVSVNSQIQPALAQLLFTWVKRDFCVAVAERGYADPERSRIAILVADEYPLFAEAQADVDFLATCRSRAAGMVSVIQSFSGLDRRIGCQAREALLANFCSSIHFASHEPELDEYVSRLLGYCEREPRPEKGISCGALQLEFENWRPRRELAVPPGALGRLETHHAYVRLADGTRFVDPVWLEPVFGDQAASAPAITPPIVVDELPRVVRRAVERNRPNQTYLDILVSGLLSWGSGSGHRLWLTPGVVAGLAQMIRTKMPRERYIDRILLASKLDGLETVPDCWLPGLDAWLAKRADLRDAVVTVSMRSGAMIVLDANGKLNRGTGTFAILGHLALTCYPCLWRRAHRRHLVKLWLHRPDLRNEVQSLPQWSEWFPTPGIPCAKTLTSKDHRPRRVRRKR